MLMGTASLQKQVQSPIRLQWLVDDFVKAAGAGDTEKVDQYIRGGIPIDRKHSVRTLWFIIIFLVFLMSPGCV